MDNLLDALASFDPIDRIEGLLRSVRVSRGLHHQHKPRLVGVRRIQWPRAAATGGEIETYLHKFGISVSNRGFTGDAQTGSLWCDASGKQAGWAQYLVDDYCNGIQHPAWVDGPPSTPRPRKRRKAKPRKPAPESETMKRIKGFFS